MTTDATSVLNPTDTSPHLQGFSLYSLRGLAVLLVVVTVVMFALAVPVAFNSFTSEYQDLVTTRMFDLGVRVQFVAGYILLLETLTYVLFVAIAAAIVWQRPDQLVSLTSAMMLVTFGAGTTASFGYLVADGGPVISTVARVVANSGYVLFVWFLYTVPDGRFQPKWSKFVWLAWIGYLIAEVFGLVGFINGDFLALAPFLLQVLVYGLGFAVIGYRMKFVYTPAQRQQVKWVVLGMTIAFIGFVLRFLPPLLFPILATPTATLKIFDVLTLIAMRLAILALPISIAIAVMRFRLYDVDLALNRSLVYGAVTVLVILMTVGDIALVLWLIRLITGGEQPTLAVVIGTTISVAVFEPLRRGMQRFVDRNLFGIEIDYRGLPRAGSNTPPTPLRIPLEVQEIGPYRVMGSIGRGGMAEVFQGYHPTLNRPVAIKVLSPELAGEEDFQKRFTREAQTIANLNHPNIVQVFDFGYQDATTYMVMEYVDGPSLSQMLRQRDRLPLDEALPLIKDVAAALDFAHLQGVIHRDVKPSNVLLRLSTATDDDRTLRAVLTDFGIAKIVGGDSLTRTGMMGTLDYIAPEQIKAAADVDGRADVYALGIMAYQMLTGTLPFKADNPGAVVMGHLNKPAPDPRDHVPEIPPHVAGAVMRALAKEPRDRFTTAGAFAQHCITAPEVAIVR